MQTDRYGLTLSTASAPARDAFVTGVDLMLCGLAGADTPLAEAAKHDPNFALAHIALARLHQMWDRPAPMQQALAAAQACTGLTHREQSHLNALTLLMQGQSAKGKAAVDAHLLDHPRDAVIAQTCCGVFSLIGFSGLPGREYEQLAFTSALAPHYGDDWWFNGQHAFSQMEADQIAPAAKTIEVAITGNPRNANAAHVRSHLYYENAETAAGLGYLRDWITGYTPGGILFTHLHWHVALWALEAGNTDLMWQTARDHLEPGAHNSPAINILTDLASLLYRAELRGHTVTPDQWQSLSHYAAEAFPSPGIAFADAHAALAHAMAGNTEALSKIIENPKGPAGDLVVTMAEAFHAFAAADWPRAEGHFTLALRDHARLGGSRAQRDLLEHAMACTLLRQGRGPEARRLLSIRRPRASAGGAVVDHLAH
ncbi:tetratricopeptide repeat protein [Alphaproteobacteria bacterium KMM 3653]|uniref:Tetratricopeptide repeat protein 38 n=1 Tax=Harenicola maris TaxID=2841044 RepID=A0AAP2CNE0_9RHOB|nr:tetratricopeptide repeat protein [Harenicola maris]